MRQVVQDVSLQNTGTLIQISTSNGGLPKLAVSGPRTLSPLGVPGDRQRDLRHHGGPDKAVLMIAGEVVDDLARKGFAVQYGTLGENLTVKGLDPNQWRAGQRYRIGETAEIELTSLRVPCSNLRPFGGQTGKNIGKELYDKRCEEGDIESPVWGFGGFYARVLRSGLIGPGAPVVLLSDVA